MNRKLINGMLIVMAVAIVIIIGRDFIGKKAGKPIENPYEYNIDEFKKVDSTKILYSEKLNLQVNADYWAGIAVTDSTIIVATANKLLKFNYKGKLISSTQTIDTATCVAVDENRQIWIGMRHYVVMYDANGKLIKRWNSFGENSVITSMAVSGENVYVADAGNRIVYQCNTNGQLEQKIGEKDEHKGVPGFVIPSPYFDVALDDRGFLWVANTGRHVFENYTQDGSLRTSWGVTSFKIEGFSGCCNPAHFAILDDNSFVTSEKGMPRIKLYDQHGQFSGVVAAPGSFSGSLAPDIAVDKQHRVIALDFERQQVRIFERKK
jgi:ligand-binding sensor domain-containing protein